MANLWQISVWWSHTVLPKDYNIYVLDLQVTVYIQIYYNIALYLENKRYVLFKKNVLDLL
jgi:hypothetical protein